MATDDPRIYFAAERTLLAWVRTGIAIMAFGFVVARFGLFLQLVSQQSDAFEPSAISPYLGAALVALGIVSMIAGAAEYRRYCQTLRPEDLPRPGAARLPLALSWALVALGVVLVLVLLT